MHTIAQAVALCQWGSEHSLTMGKEAGRNYIGPPCPAARTPRSGSAMPSGPDPQVRQRHAQRESTQCHSIFFLHYRYRLVDTEWTGGIF